MTGSRALALTAFGPVLAALSFAPPYPEAAAIDDVGAEPVRIAIEVGESGFDDEPVMAIRKTSMRY